MRIYEHYHDPEKYPEFALRPIRATTRAALENEIQFMSLRDLPHDEDDVLHEIEEALDLYTKRFDLGKVFWMRSNIVNAPNLDVFVDAVARRGGYVFDLWGFVPGSYKKNLDWGEYTVLPEVHRLFTEKLGDHFIGYDNGEQDGRYIGSYTRTQCPARQSDAFQQRRFYEFFDKMGSQLQHATTALCSLNYCHFFARENNCYMLGAETAQALPNANLWYAYLRGAGKQYGLLWFGNASVYNRFSWKTYDVESTIPRDGYSYGPLVGTSLSLLRRLIYVEYLYNSDMLGYESGLITTRGCMERVEAGEPLDVNPSSSDKSLFTGDDAVLSPIGRLQADCKSFIARRGRAGAMYTPIAIVLSASNGWTMPRHLYAPEVYRVWGEIPYREQDHQLHALFTMLYPGYEDSGFFLNERGFLTPTPYGEHMDVLMSDMRPETLGQYNVALLAGGQSIDAEQLDKLRAFAESGGTVAAFAGQMSEQALALFGVRALGAVVRREDALTIYRGRKQREEAFDLFEAELEDAEVVAQLEDGAPLIVERRLGRGRCALVLSPYGMRAVRSAEPMHNEENRSIPLLYDLMPTVKAYLADLFDEQRLVDVDNPSLEVIVNLRGEHTLTVTVVNNSFTCETYALKLRCGRERSRQQIELPDVEMRTPGYFPPFTAPHRPFAPAGGREVLGPGQMAMWDIEYDCDEIERLPEVEMRDLRGNLYVSLRPEGALIDALIAMPSLDKYFAGVRLDAADVDDLSLRQARQAGSWLKRRGLGVMVDFASLMDHYPHMSLIRNMPWKLEENLRWMEELMDKAAALGASRVLLTTHRNAENHLTPEQAAQDMRETLTALCEMAEQRKMQPVMVNGVARAERARPEELASLMPELPLAVNLSHCLLRGEQPAPDTLKRAEGLLLSMPLRDELGQLCDAHLPLKDGAFAAELARVLAGCDPDAHAFVCLDGVYGCFDEMYQDRRAYLAMKNGL